MSAREIEHAALRWHAAHMRRLAIGAEKRRLAKAIKAAGDGADAWPLRSQECQAASQLTEARRKELAAVRELAKACAAQRARLDDMDVIDVEVKQLVSKSSASAEGREDSRPTPP